VVKCDRIGLSNQRRIKNMNMAKYCKDKGFTLEQYETLKGNIDATAQATLLIIKGLHKPDTGVYYPVDEIFNPESDETIKGFIMVELKRLGVEFFDNNTLYRY
jgi:hypothetical protein